MNLYLEHERFRLYQGNAAKLDLIEDKSVDLICTDPPYGIQYQSGHRYEKFNPIQGDKLYPYVLMKDALWEAHRVLKPAGAIYIFTGWSTFHKLFPQVSEFFILGNPIVWVKSNWSAGNLLSSWANRTEIIVHAYKKGFKLRGARPANTLPFKRIDGTKLKHPTEKPVPLLEYLISKSSDKDDIVLDQFMGSGPVIESAVKLGRRAIGVELEEKYCEVARKRLFNLPAFAFPDMEINERDFELTGLHQASEE